MNIRMLQLAVAVLMMGYPLMLWVFVRAKRVGLAAVVASEAKRSAQVFMEGTRALTEQLTAVTIEVERARAVAEEERGKTVRYFRKITDFETERTRWQKLYNEQSIGHGNAQQLMMTTIEALARQLQAKGVRVQIPKVLHALREEFASTHEMPSRDQVEALRAIEAAKASLVPATETQDAVSTPSI